MQNNELRSQNDKLQSQNNEFERRIEDKMEIITAYKALYAEHRTTLPHLSKTNILMRPNPLRTEVGAKHGDQS